MNVSAFCITPTPSPALAVIRRKVLISRGGTDKKLSTVNKNIRISTLNRSTQSCADQDVQIVRVFKIYFLILITES